MENKEKIEKANSILKLHYGFDNVWQFYCEAIYSSHRSYGWYLLAKHLLRIVDDARLKEHHSLNEIVARNKPVNMLESVFCKSRVGRRLGTVMTSLEHPHRKATLCPLPKF